MQRRLILFLILAVILAGSVKAEISVNPSTIYFDYTIGMDTSKEQIINLTNLDTGGTVRYSATDIRIVNYTNWLKLNETRGNLSRYNASSSVKNSTLLLKLTMSNISTSVTEGIYTAQFMYGSAHKDILIQIRRTTAQGCRIDPIVTNYITTVKTGTNPFVKTFSVVISSECTGPVDIKTPQLIGVTETSEGAKPIKLSGALSLGLKDPGREAAFDIEFDVTGMQSGLYQPKIIIPGYYNGVKLQGIIDFSVYVSTSLTPTTDELKPPTYSIPETIRVKDPFEIKITNLDPRLSPQIFFNEYLVGLSVDDRGTHDDEWIWKGYINKTGTFPISVTSTYRGGNIGPVYTRNVKVVENVNVGSGNLSIDMCTTQSGCGLDGSKLQDGDIVNVMIRDSGTKNLVPGATLYVNGLKNDAQTFTIVAGNKYVLSASHSIYPTKDITIQVTQKIPLITIDCPNNPPELGDTCSIRLKDPKNAALLSNVTATLDEVKLATSTLTLSSIGPHTLAASAPGFQAATFNFNVTDVAILLAPPDKITRNKQFNVSLSKPANWYVQYSKVVSENQQQQIETVSEGSSNMVIFTPNKNGDYNIFANGKYLRKYSVTGFQISGKTMLIAGGIFVFIIILIMIFKSGGGRSKSSMGFPSGGEFSSGL
jgi:hypothetical protein